MTIEKKDLPTSGASYRNVLIVLCAVFLYLWCVCQWVAYKLGFQQALGLPLMNLGTWKFYEPWAFLVWETKFNSHPVARDIFETGRVIFLAGFGIITIGLTIFLGVMTRKLGAVKTHDAFSSTWADDIDVAYSGLMAKDSWATQQELKSLKK